MDYVATCDYAGGYAFEMCSAHTSRIPADLPYSASPWLQTVSRHELLEHSPLDRLYHPQECRRSAPRLPGRLHYLYFA